MLNLPPQPGAIGTVLLLLGAAIGLPLLVALLRRLDGDRVAVAAVAGTLAASAAAAPFTTWRVVEDIRANRSFDAAHARYVGAETKLIDGELAERIGHRIAVGETYYVVVAPDAFEEIRESLRFWLGYALLPRRQVLELAEADHVVTWGALPANLGIQARAPHLVGRNRLYEDEPVYVASRR